MTVALPYPVDIIERL